MPKWNWNQWELMENQDDLRPQEIIDIQAAGDRGIGQLGAFLIAFNLACLVGGITLLVLILT